MNDEQSDIEKAAEILASAIRMMSEENCAIAERDRESFEGAIGGLAHQVADLKEWLAEGLNNIADAGES